MSLLSGSLWQQLTPGTPDFPPLFGQRDADLAVIGGGILGLSAALKASERGLKTVLLEAGQPGAGASGRNTGFVVPSLKSDVGLEELRAGLGAAHADRLLRLVAGSGDAVFARIKMHHIDCAPVQNGWLQPGHTQAAEAMLRARLPALRSAGVETDFLTRAEMFLLTGLPRLYGGLRVKSGGQINPLAYVRGLARAVLRTGAGIFGDSAVLRISPNCNGWRLETDSGTVMARQVLLATNALVGDVVPAMRAAILPVRVFQIATDPLPAAFRARVLPARAPVADTRRHTFALRWSEDGRLITGGLVGLWPDQRRRAAGIFLRRIRQQVPDCPPLAAEAVWSGMIAVTPDALPRLIRLGPGFFGAIGCNGRGVALSTALGAEIARFLAEEIGEDSLALPITSPRPLRLRSIAGLAPHLLLPVMNFRDWQDTRDRSPALSSKKECL